MASATPGGLRGEPDTHAKRGHPARTVSQPVTHCHGAGPEGTADSEPRAEAPTPPLRPDSPRACHPLALLSPTRPPASSETFQRFPLNVDCSFQDVRLERTPGPPPGLTLPVRAQPGKVLRTRVGLKLPVDGRGVRVSSCSSCMHTHTRTRKTRPPPLRDAGSSGPGSGCWALTNPSPEGWQGLFQLTTLTDI